MGKILIVADTQIESKFDSGLNTKATEDNGIDAKSLNDSLDRATDPITADGSYEYGHSTWVTDDKMLSRKDKDVDWDPKDDKD